MSSSNSAAEPLDELIIALEIRPGLLIGGVERNFFDFVPDDVLDNIIRHVSLRPRRTDWPSFIKPDDVRTLYYIGGAITDFCRTRFTAVRTRQNLGFYRDGALYLNDQRANVVFPSVRPAGGQFRFISFSHRYPSMNVDENWVQMFQAQCTCVSSLDTSGIEDIVLLDSILAICGERLDTLAANCSTTAFVSSIARHCVRIRDIKIVGEHTELLPIWVARSSTLEKLTFDFGIRNRQEVRNIQIHCRGLHEVNIWQSLDAEEDLRPYIAELYISYRGQLEIAFLEPMVPDVGRQIADSCPNVRLKTTLKEQVSEVLHALGPRLDKARFLFDNNSRLANVAQAAMHGENLAEINVLTGRSLESISALLAGANDSSFGSQYIRRPKRHRRYTFK